MTKPSAVRKAAAEADRILNELNAKPGEASPGEGAGEGNQPSPSGMQAPDKSAPAPAADAVAPPAEPAPAPAAPPPAEDFRTKYDVLRNKYDAEVPLLTNKISEQDERIRGLERMLASMAPPPAPTKAEETFETYVKPEDITEYGKDFFDVVGRRAKEIVSPEVKALRKKVEELEGKLTTTVAKTAEATRAQVFKLLGERVPDWQTVNVDQGFLAWLSDVDVLSGRQRKELLTEAFEANHAERVVRFFESFKEDSGRTAPTTSAPAAPVRQPQVPIENLVAPGTSRAATPEAPGAKRVWSEQEVSEFYARRRRKMIPDEEFARTEREILQAVAEGRVR